MSKSLEYAIRILLGLALTAGLWWAGASFLGVSFHPESPGAAFITAAWVVFISLAWFLVLGLPVLDWLGRTAGGLFWPGDDASRVRPDYSIAEARFQQGRYEEAIMALRRDIAKYPTEVFPHVRIAEIELEKHHNPEAAITEMAEALAKASGADSLALVTNRLVDLLLEHRKDRARSIGLLEEIQRRYPDSKHAQAAAQRIARLR